MNIISDPHHKSILLAPMAGITDAPFRKLCRTMGAHACVSEMISSNPALYDSRKTRLRRDYHGEASPKVIQIAGADPVQMAQAAIYNIDLGADVIDINMGCPAKKVCNAMAGSSLLKDELLVSRILDSVVRASRVPVTLKIRTGWDKNSRNACRIGKIAEESGIKLLTVHGRTRACRFDGSAEYDTIAEVKAQVSIPVIANGDITSAQKAAGVLRQTGADGVMIGRAARGNPWIFAEIDHFLRTGTLLPRPHRYVIGTVLMSHLQELHRFYGERMGVRIARKHIAWYCNSLPGFNVFRSLINQEESPAGQMSVVAKFFDPGHEAGLAA